MRSRQAAFSITTSPLAVVAPHGPYSGCSWNPACSGSKPAPAPPSAWRRMPTASISSMKIMHVPPHLRASLRALRIRNMTMTTSMPMNVCAKPEPGIVTIGALNEVAMPLESIVLPVPGAPMNSRPRSGLPPALRKSSPA